MIVIMPMIDLVLCNDWSRAEDFHLGLVQKLICKKYSSLYMSVTPS
jgi:hypothetical protein